MGCVVQGTFLGLLIFLTVAGGASRVRYNDLIAHDNYEFTTNHIIADVIGHNYML